VIGVIGARGAVGSAAAAQLIAAGYPVRAGARTALCPDPAPRGPVEVMRVDVDDPAGLYRFCLGCDIVLNCAGPATRIGARVAVAAAAADANYVDAAGDDTLYASVREATGDRIAIVSAGFHPGLSELLPRYLAASLPTRQRRMTVWHGGRDRFAPASAIDFLVGDHGGGRGARTAGGFPGRVRVPYVPDVLTLFAEATTTASRLVRDLGLDALDRFHGFAGEHVVRVLAGRAAGGDGMPVERLIRASERDLAGTDPYQIIAVRSEDERGRVRGLVACGRGAATVAGAVAASAADQMMRGRVAAGVHHAGFALDPCRTVEWLTATGALVSVEMIDGDPCADAAGDA
jgi:hypothetical protein